MGSLRGGLRGDPRICIVGGGASGLAVAHTLERRGYRRITVLEREHRVGGKCCTILHEGRSYELGAAALTPAYRNVRMLAAEAGLPTSVILTHSFIDLEGGRASRLPLALPQRWSSIGTQGARFAREMWRHRKIGRPGFQGLSPELCMPFEAWCSARGVELIGEIMKPWITGFGYGFYREVPTAYVLKYARLFIPPAFDILEHGYSGLWERVARSLVGVDIRLGTSIGRIAREDGRVRVHTDQGVFDFDALVIACPLTEAMRFLDATPLEADLFSRIRYYDYYVVGALAEGLPRTRTLFFPRYLAPEYVGWPMFAYQRWPGSGLTFFYGFTHGRDYEAAARNAVCTTVDRLGGTVRGTPVTTCWRYFPHVSPEDMSAGFYSRLEGLQGQRATYYCGEILAFSTVETVVDYARAMVERYFAPPMKESGLGSARRAS